MDGFNVKDHYDEIVEFCIVWIVVEMCSEVSVGGEGEA